MAHLAALGYVGTLFLQGSRRSAGQEAPLASGEMHHTRGELKTFIPQHLNKSGLHRS